MHRRGVDGLLHRVAVIAGPLLPDEPDMYAAHLIGRTACGQVCGWALPMGA